jgi:hypothetical protein
MWLTKFHLELLRKFNQRSAKYLVIGGHAALLYGSERTTGDLDILVEPTKANGERIMHAFNDLALEVGDLVSGDFESPLVLSFGFEPDGVDLINYLKGFDVDLAFNNAKPFQFDQDVFAPVIDARDLLVIKQKLNREGKKGLTDQIDILSLIKYLEIQKS